MDAHTLSRFLLSLVILATAAHFFGHWFERIKLPRVIGEISAGIFLGPSVIGAIQWGTYNRFLFDEFVGHKVLLNAFYWLGLCLLMFTSGFHIQRRLPADERRDIGLLVIATSTVPFALGWWAVSFLPVDQYIQSTGNPVAFRIVFAVSVTVTSIPVISKIFMDLGLMSTKFAKVVVATATIHDIVLWTAIAVATTVQHSADVHVGELVRAVAVCIAFIAFFMAFGDRFITFINRIAPKFAFVYPVGYLLIVCLALAALASHIDVGAVFGALIAGMLFGSLPQREFQEARATIAAFAISFFVPIYFATVGLQISFQGNLDLLFTLKYLVFSSALVVMTVWPTMRVAGHSGLVAWNFCVAMTTRGGPAIVLASLAYSVGIINVRFFVTLILTSLLTDVLCGVWFRFVIDRRLELYEGASAPTGSPDQGGIYAHPWEKQHGFEVSADGTRAAVQATRLQAVPLFASLVDALLQELAVLFVTERFPAERTIFQEGDPGDKFYLIVHGSVRVTTTGPAGEICELAICQDGDYFGEIALLQDIPRTATVRTQSPSLLLSLQRDQFRQLIETSPALHRLLQEAMTVRLAASARLKGDGVSALEAL